MTAASWSVVQDDHGPFMAFMECVRTTRAALLEYNEAFSKLTTANGGTFTSSLATLSSQSRYSTLDQWMTCFNVIGYWDWLSLMKNVPPFAVVSSSVSTWFDTTWTGSTASRIYMCKSVVGMKQLFTISAESSCWEILLYQSPGRKSFTFASFFQSKFRLQNSTY